MPAASEENPRSVAVRDHSDLIGLRLGFIKLRTSRSHDRCAHYNSEDSPRSVRFFVNLGLGLVFMVC